MSEQGQGYVHGEERIVVSHDDPNGTIEGGLEVENSLLNELSEYDPVDGGEAETIGESRPPIVGEDALSQKTILQHNEELVALYHDLPDRDSSDNEPSPTGDHHMAMRPGLDPEFFPEDVLDFIRDFSLLPSSELDGGQTVIQVPYSMDHVSIRNGSTVSLTPNRKILFSVLVGKTIEYAYYKRTCPMIKIKELAASRELSQLFLDENETSTDLDLHNYDISTILAFNELVEKLNKVGITKSVRGSNGGIVLNIRIEKALEILNGKEVLITDTDTLNWRKVESINPMVDLSLIPVYLQLLRNNGISNRRVIPGYNERQTRSIIDTLRNAGYIQHTKDGFYMISNRDLIEQKVQYSSESYSVNPIPIVEKVKDTKTEILGDAPVTIKATYSATPIHVNVFSSNPDIGRSTRLSPNNRKVLATLIAETTRLTDYCSIDPWISTTRLIEIMGSDYKWQIRRTLTKLKKLGVISKSGENNRLRVYINDFEELLHSQAESTLIDVDHEIDWDRFNLYDSNDIPYLIPLLEELTTVGVFNYQKDISRLQKKYNQRFPYMQDIIYRYINSGLLSEFDGKRSSVGLLDYSQAKSLLASLDREYKIIVRKITPNQPTP